MNDLSTRALEARTTGHPVHPMLLGRWSPRAMTGEAISDEDLMTLFDAARWAPSSYNEQPWRFIYAKRDTPEWDALFGLLGEWNQGWCKQASALVVILSSKFFKLNGKPNVNHSFDTGSAWMSMAIQGASMGLVVHGMAGFDFDRAASELGVPDSFAVEAMCAVGVLADPSSLPEDLASQEVPSDRNPLVTSVMHGRFIN